MGLGAGLTCRKLLQWSEDQKQQWIASPSCSPLLGDSFLFACKQVLEPMFLLCIWDKFVVTTPR